jgi:Beta-lactamase
VRCAERSLATSKYSAQLYAFLAHYELPRQTGTKWDYSNIGYSLLGKALAAWDAVDFAAPINIATNRSFLCASMPTYVITSFMTGSLRCGSGALGR